MSSNTNTLIARVSQERVLEALSPLLEGYFGDDFMEEVLVSTLTFLHTTVLLIADTALWKGEEDEDDSSDEDTSDEEMQDEEDIEEWDEEDEDEEDIELPEVSEELHEWIKKFVFNIRNEVLNTHYLDLMKLCGMDVKKALRLARSYKPYESALTYQLDPKIKEKLTNLVLQSYDSMVINLDLKQRPSYQALQIYKKSEGSKDEQDKEDEKTVEKYILEHPTECLEFEKEEIAYLIPELLEEHGEALQTLVTTVGPKMMADLMSKRILPKIIEEDDRPKVI